MPRPRKIVAEPTKAKKPPQIRLAPEERREQLLSAGYDIAAKSGIKAATRIAVAEATGTTDGLINRYFAGKKGMHAAILEHAATKKNAVLVAHAHAVHGFELPPMTNAFAAEVKRTIKTYAAPAKA